MGRGISEEEDLSNYFPIEQPQTSPPSLPQQIRASPRLSRKATFKGFRFEDNKAKYAWEDGKNGMAQLNFDSFLPPSMTVCMRGRILYNRHGDINSWVNLIIKRRETPIGSDPMDFNFYQQSKGQWYLYGADNTFTNWVLMNKEEEEKAKEAKSWPSRNSIRKWTHVCVVGDFLNEKKMLIDTDTSTIPLSLCSTGTGGTFLLYPSVKTRTLQPISSERSLQSGY